MKKISFISHSVGGLVARYAIGKLYKPPTEASREEVLANEESKSSIAGLEPVSFITVATPHLGSRGNKQVSVYLLLTAFVFLWYKKKLLNDLHVTVITYSMFCCDSYSMYCCVCLSNIMVALCVTPFFYRPLKCEFCDV